jgi:hypothetical protein
VFRGESRNRPFRINSLLLYFGKGLILSGDDCLGYSIQTEQGDTSVNEIGDIADAWASGFGIYPALETVSAPASAAPGGPSPAGRSGVSRRLALAGLVLGGIGLCALIADVATVIIHG